MSSVGSIGGNADLYSMLSPSQIGQSSGGPFASKIMSQLDTNGDGVIDKAEFSSALANFAQTNGQTAVDSNALFAKLDSNGDGNVSQQELAQAAQKSHHHHHHADQDGGGSTGSVQNKSGSALNAFIAQILQTYQSNTTDSNSSTGSSISVTA